MTKILSVLLYLMCATCCVWLTTLAYSEQMWPVMVIAAGAGSGFGYLMIEEYLGE